MEKISYKGAILAYISTLITFFMPLAPLLVLVFFAVVADTFVGRWYAKKEGEEVTSKKTREGFTLKMITYGGGLVFIYLLDVWILNKFVLHYFPQEYLSTLFTALFLIWIEYTSVDEKIKWTTGKGITDRLFEFVSKIKKTIKTLVDFRDQRNVE
jgi:CDP-diglyceride synthetase